MAIGAFALTDSLADASALALAFSKESEARVARSFPNVHGGNGTISVRYFPFDNAPSPAHFVIYEIPPGASEGVHTHHLGDMTLGPYDEYYYVIEGQGEMQIDGTPSPLRRAITSIHRSALPMASAIP
jgi:hypothetical protein